jgi:hypothetical protein
MPHLPDPLIAYFALASEAETTGLAEVFVADAIVRDEGREHRGLAAIRDWRVDTMARTPFTARPLSVDEQGGVLVVAAEVTGAFPGSPLKLAHRFTLRGGRVAVLEIG